MALCGCEEPMFVTGIENSGSSWGPGCGGEPPISTPSPETKSRRCSAFPPVDMELALCSAILEPIKAHVDGFGAALFDCVIDDAGCTTVVDLKGCRWLGMAHFFQDDTEDDSFAGIEETRAKFCFGGGGQDDVEDGA
eukprot:scaffold14236_cov54-Attheya_sp.AAC.3